jgi:ubiquinone/menaquinone biosynthesis C-methylase UbiE
MIHHNAEVLKYWDRDDVESMYDKNLLQAEVSLLSSRIGTSRKVLDAGCGEGEGTFAYASRPGIVIHAVDFSETRLRKARERLQAFPNVKFVHGDFLDTALPLDADYDAVISQRFLINLMEWELQQRVLRRLVQALRSGGRLIMLEGSTRGVDELNAFRAFWGLPPIPVKWHNLFFDDESLIQFMESCGCRLHEVTGLGSYFLLTRGLRPVFEKELDWNTGFNRISASGPVEAVLGLGARCSRLRLFVFERLSG